MNLGDIECIYSGKRDGVGLMMNEESAKACLSCDVINNRMVIVHIMTKK